MISFNKPTNLNGAELRQELNDAGVAISNDIFAIKLDGEKVLWLDIATKDKSKAQAVVDAHDGII
jgi:hypothetical protein